MIGLKRSVRVGERKEYKYVVAGVHSINSQREKLCNLVLEKEKQNETDFRREYRK